jgi:hypothetical protein
MSDIKHFRFQSGRTTELQGDASGLETLLPNLIEANTETLMGKAHDLAVEYAPRGRKWAA